MCWSVSNRAKSQYDEARDGPLESREEQRHLEWVGDTGGRELDDHSESDSSLYKMEFGGEIDQDECLLALLCAQEAMFWTIDP